MWGSVSLLTSRPGKASLKVGLYGDIDSADDQGSHQWRLLALLAHQSERLLAAYEEAAAQRDEFVELLQEARAEARALRGES